MAVLRNAISLLRLSMGSSVGRNFVVLHTLVDKQLVLDMIVDKQLVLDMIADEQLVLDMIVVVEEMSRFVIVEELLKSVDCTVTDDWCILEVIHKLCINLKWFHCHPDSMHVINQLSKPESFDPSISNLTLLHMSLATV
ncbi:hypothetical protein Tco_0199224 [Tanacetum coccineum]